MGRRLERAFGGRRFYSRFLLAIFIVVCRIFVGRRLRED
jgi:hypothetical protein